MDYDYIHNTYLTKTLSEGGCLVPDIHVRLGSKIHTDRFYETERLLSDEAVLNFLADEICDRIPEDKKVRFILGQYAVTSWLLDIVAKKLRERGRQEKPFVIDFLYDEKSGVTFHENLTSAENNDVVLCIVPVGTTLSNVYKVHDVFIKQSGAEKGDAKKSFEFLDFCVLASGDCFMDPQSLKNMPTIIKWFFPKGDRKTPLP